MLNSIFSAVETGSSGAITLRGFLISIAAALVLGAGMALIYTYKTAYTKSFAVTLATLPAIVAIIIMMVSGSLGAGVAVAGTFSLVRFRSAPGTAREIGAIFLSMAIGLACGMGYHGFAALFTLIMCFVSLLYAKIGFGEKKGMALNRTLSITVPENLNYTGAFDDLFEKYASDVKLLRVKTTNFGSLNKLTYFIRFRQAGAEKNLIDELRCRNENPESCSACEQAGNQEL